MVIVVLSGGIGAQVFQFAAGYELSKKNNCGLIIDACWFKKNNEFATKPFTIDEFLDLKALFTSFSPSGLINAPSPLPNLLTDTLKNLLSQIHVILSTR